MDIRNKNDLEIFLEGKPAEWARILALRAALRVFPAWRSPPKGRHLTLQVLRALFISRTEILWPSGKLSAAAVSAASAAATAVNAARYNFAPASASARAISAAAASAAARSAYSAADGATFSAAISAAADAAAIGGAATWRELTTDARRLQATTNNPLGNREVLLAPAWFENPPSTLATRWSELKSELLSHPNEHWAPWTEWYDRVLAGEQLPFADLTEQWAEDFCTRIATMPPISWREPFAKVNKEFFDRLNVYREIDLEELPEVPPQRPATLRPEWHGEVLSLPSDLAQVDKGIDFAEVLKALKEDLTELADDLAAESKTNTIDPKIIAFIQRLAARIPVAIPTQYDVHRLGLAKSNLTNYLTMVVAEEWEGFWSARIVGTLAHFDLAMNQLPSWREFIRNASEVGQAPLDVPSVAMTLQTVAAALSNPEITIVAPTIPAAMMDQSNQLGGLQDEGLAFNKQWIAYDARESARNTFKSLAGKFGTFMATWLSQGFMDEHKEFGEKLGHTLHKVIVATGVGLGAWSIAYATGLNLANLAALAAKTPEVVEFLGGKEGWIALFLGYIAAHWARKKK